MGILIVFPSPVFSDEAYTPAQKREVIQDVWAAFDASFYDPNMRGVDWVAVRDEMIGRAAGGNLEALVFEMIARLKNSHSGYRPPSDQPVFSHFLPFAFERVTGRVYVTVPNAASELSYGDEVLAVDGQPVSALRPPVRSYLLPRRGNPYYGAEGSIATVELAGDRTVALRRVRTREPEVDSIGLPSGVMTIRFLALSSAADGAMDSPSEVATGAQGVVLDLRYCGGGFPASGLKTASWLLGPAKLYGTIVPRNASGSEDYGASAPSGEAIAAIVGRGRRARLWTHERRAAYSGPLAVLISGNTGSECEVLASVLQEHGRARLFGTRTEGALNGWTQSHTLPHGAGSIAIPVTATISPKGKEYEGRGVVPDEVIAASADDFQKRFDPARERAVRWLAGQRREVAGSAPTLQ